MLLEYAGEAKLYVPLTRMDLVQKYRGAGEGGAAARPARRRDLGQDEIARQGQDARHGGRASEALRAAADGRRVLVLAPTATGSANLKTRSNSRRRRTSLPRSRQIKRDMESAQPMDRLLCGDVGFGKTEVAMRAAFKALGDGKQVAVLAPTTVLALPALTRRSSGGSRRFRCASRCSAASAVAKEIKAVAGRDRRRQSRHRHRHASAAVEGRRVPRSRPAGRGRRAALRRRVTRNG